MRSVVLAYLLTVFSYQASAIEPCYENPCANDLVACTSKVDWILDGTIISASNDTVKCEDPPKSQSLSLWGLCSQNWDGGIVEFKIDRAVKGIVPKGTSKLTLKAADHCWEQHARVSEDMVGKTVRIYGVNPEHSRSGAYLGIVRVVLLSDINGF